MVISTYCLSWSSLSLQLVHWRSRCYQTCRKLIWDCWDAFFFHVGDPHVRHVTILVTMKPCVSWDPSAGGWCHDALCVLLLAPAKRITVGSRVEETLVLTCRYGRKELEGCIPRMSGFACLVVWVQLHGRWDSCTCLHQRYFWNKRHKEANLREAEIWRLNPQCIFNFILKGKQWEKSLKGTYLSVSFKVIPPQRSDFITSERRKQKMELFLLFYHVYDMTKTWSSSAFCFSPCWTAVRLL